MRVLVACEFSGVVRRAFNERGHQAWSCDLLPADDGSPFHYQGDAILNALGDEYDLLIAHPPCTHLSVSGARHFEKKRGDGRQQRAIEFFMEIARLPIPRIAIENPVGIMSTIWRKPDQIIQPFYFGDEFQKTTCLWLKNLPPLVHVTSDDLIDKQTHVGRGEFVTFASGKRMSKWFAESAGDGHTRSRTFPGIAAAMADQWGCLDESIAA